jgi:hypothetical protein
MPFEDRADQIARLLARTYEIHEVIIAETGGIQGLRYAASYTPPLPGPLPHSEAKIYIRQIMPKPLCCYIRL